MENPFDMNRDKKRESRSEARFRFSDLVNANNRSVYLSRESREDYHGCGIVLAKEIEYTSMVQTGRRCVDMDSFNENRFILGHFWLISEAQETEQQELFARRMGSFKSIIPRHALQSHRGNQTGGGSKVQSIGKSKTPFRRSSCNQLAKQSSDRDLRLVRASDSGKSGR